MLRFLLINPRTISRENDPSYPPIGLAMISAVLKRDGYYVKGLNLDYNLNNLSLKDQIIKSIRENNINVVAIGSLTNRYNQVKEILDYVKTYDNSILTILGGGILNYRPEGILNTLSNLDIGVIGEGETTIVKLANALENKNSLDEINGLIFKKDENIVLTEAVKVIKDLDRLPFPDYDEFDTSLFLDLQLPLSDYTSYIYDKPRYLPLFVSRSCPYGCTFCSHTIGRKYRSFSLDYFFKHLDYVIEKYNINILHVADELFSMNKKRLKEFCERIKDYNIVWFAQTRVDEVNEETLLMMKNAGCYYISYGVEHVNNNILKSMKKRIKLEDTEKALDLTYNLNIGMQANILIGDIQETESTFLEALDWIIKHKKYYLNFGYLILYPGTPIYDYAVSNNIIPNQIEFLERNMSDEMINFTSMSDEVYKKINNIRVDVYKTTLTIYGEVLNVQFIEKDKWNRDLFKLETICGHCNKKNEYNNFHLNRLLHNGESLKISCRHCNHKYDIKLEKIFSFYKEKIANDLKKFIKKRTPIYLIGCKDENYIRREFEYLEIDFNEINFLKFLDNNPQRINKPYLNGIVEDYNLIDFEKNSDEIVFIIPALGNDNATKAIKTMLISKGISEESIFCITKKSVGYVD